MDSYADHEEHDLDFYESSIESISIEMPAQLDYLKTQIDGLLEAQALNEEIRHAITQEFDQQRNYQKQLFQVASAVKKAARSFQEKLVLINQEMHEISKSNSSYQTSNESLNEELKNMTKRIENMEKEIEQSDRTILTFKSEVSTLKTDLQESRKEQQRLQKISDSFSKRKQSISETVQHEKSHLDEKIKELEVSLQLKDEEYEKLQQINELLEQDKFKLDRQLENMSNDLQHYQTLREQDEFSYHKMLEDHMVTIESLRTKVGQKEQELKKYVLQEQNMKNQEQFQNNGDYMFRQQTTPKQSLTSRDSGYQNYNPQLGHSNSNNYDEVYNQEFQNINQQQNRGSNNFGDVEEDPNHMERSFEKKNSMGQSSRQPRQKQNQGLRQDKDTQTNDLELCNNELEDFEQEYDLYDYQQELTRELMKNKSNTQSMVTEAPDRKNPEEEYFRLTVLSVKMLHNEKNQDYVIEVNPKKLYKKVKSEKIAFHCWYPWVEKEILEIAKTQRPDLYLKKKGFMQRIKSIFGNKNQQNLNESMISNSSFIRTDEMDVSSSFTPKTKDAQDQILSTTQSNSSMNKGKSKLSELQFSEQKQLSQSQIIQDHEQNPYKKALQQSTPQKSQKNKLLLKEDVFHQSPQNPPEK
eukprot:403373885